MSVIIDTNVIAVADGKDGERSARCIARSADCLLEASRDVVLVDAGMDVLAEYVNNITSSWPLSPGARFVRELQNNLFNPARCRQVSITPAEDRVYAEFPDDDALADFDRSDRKFVAVRLVSGENAPIFNSVDSDWWFAKDALEVHGVEVRFLCPEHMPGDP